MSMRETAGRIEFERFGRAFAERDPEALIGLYADDAELQIVDCNRLCTKSRDRTLGMVVRF